MLGLYDNPGIEPCGCKSIFVQYVLSRLFGKINKDVNFSMY